MSVLFYLLLLLFPLPASADDWTWRDGTLRETGRPERLYQKDHFRIFYYLDGRDAVSPTDADQNGVPDYVEDVARQLWAAHAVLCRIYGFPSPLDSARYEKASFIDARIVHSEKIYNMRGITLRGPQPAVLAPGKKALVMYLSKALDFRLGTTPLHEYFHMIQNSVSSIRNSWYMEGLARWSENALRADKLFAEKNWDFEKITQSKSVWQYVCASSYYGAKTFWNPLSLRFPGRADFSLLVTDQDKNSLKQLAYSNGMPVIQDFLLPGADLIQSFLLELGRLDGQASSKTNESAEPQNNALILQALKAALVRQNASKQ